MRLDIARPDLVLVTMSRRNLLALLAIVEQGEMWETRALYRQQEVEAPVLALAVEPDDVHYRGRRPGQMSTFIEEWIYRHERDGR